MKKAGGADSNGIDSDRATTNAIVGSRCSRGHPSAKAELFHRYASQLERLITHLLGYDAELADVRAGQTLVASGSDHRLQLSNSEQSPNEQAALDAGFAGYLVYAFTPGWQTVGFDFDARATEPLVGPGGTLATFAAQLRDP